MVILLEIINKLLWVIAISFILINSVYFTVKLKFPQLKIISTLKSLLIKENTKEISPKDTLIMTLSSKIGVGSLSGAALCVCYAGYGTIFWIFISTFFLSILNYIENALAIIYKNNAKEPTGGPMYYIKKGLHNNCLSKIYSSLILVTYIFLFISIQNNTITTLTTNMFPINKIIISTTITILATFSILKGIKTISNICNKIFPIMISILISIGIIVLLKNFSNLTNIIKLVIQDAFNYKAVVGGIIHIIIFSFQKSVFANESGVGTSGIISGASESNDYKMQAKLGLIQTYFINFIILGITSFIIITAKDNNPEVINGIELTKSAFSYHLGYFGEILLLLILLLFSFSSIITIYYYGESCLRFLTKNKIAIKVLKLITILSIFTGGIIKATAIWNLLDIFLAILTIINMYVIYKLKNIIISKLKWYNYIGDDMITKKWDEILSEEYKKEYFINMLKHLQIEYREKEIYPPKSEVFKALRLTDYDNIKVVILGQDPYHGTGEAEGLSFSVKDGIRKPPSLKNIFKELKDDLGYDEPKSGSLVGWAKEGVLLLNSILTVEKDKPLSHKPLGWEKFTDEIIKRINEKDTPVVFILWGAYARSKKAYITNPIHYIIESPHPSPFSARYGFFGSKPFSKTNNFLKTKKISPVNFKLD